jgi:hypothetical protein
VIQSLGISQDNGRGKKRKYENGHEMKCDYFRLRLEEACKGSDVREATDGEIVVTYSEGVQKKGS